MDQQVLRLLSLRVRIFSSPCGGGTLAACCASIVDVLPTLKLNVHLLVSLLPARDKSLHEKALEAIRDAKWESMFRCVGYFCCLGRQDAEQELEQGKHVDCCQNVRLIHWPTITR